MQNSWGNNGEKNFKKVQKITQMFAMSKTPKVLKYQSKPLISLKYKKQAGRPHNPKAVNSSLALAIKSYHLNFLLKNIVGNNKKIFQKYNL